MIRALVSSLLLLAVGSAADAQDHPPTHADVKYGPHERNVMDVWQAKSETPTPVLVSIHGGGFAKGDKRVPPELLRLCLDSGISVVAITYRYSNQAIAPAQFHDGARAVQFIRHNARQWNLDPKRVAATGNSAGAGISLWLAFHDDLVDAGSEDPVLRQSSRLTCASVFNGQTSYDPRFIREILPGSDTYKHVRIAQLFDVDLEKLDDLPKEKYELFEAVSPIYHATKDDPPVQLLYEYNIGAPVKDLSIGIHHPKFGEVLKERLDKLKVECDLKARIRPADGDALTFDFIKKHL